MRDAVDAKVSQDERHSLRTAKSCGPGAPMQAPSLAKMRVPRISPATVANKLVHRGEPEVSCKPLRRECRVVSAEPVWSTRAFAQLFRAVTAGAASTWHSLRPLNFQEGVHRAKPGREAPREREHSSSPRHCEERKRRPAVARYASYGEAWSHAEAPLREGGSNLDCIRGESLDCFANARSDRGRVDILGAERRKNGCPRQTGSILK